VSPVDVQKTGSISGWQAQTAEQASAPSHCAMHSLTYVLPFEQTTGAIEGWHAQVESQPEAPAQVATHSLM